jgi:hypothetical protein
VVKKLSKLSHIMETRESWESNQDAILEASLLDNAIISLIVVPNSQGADISLDRQSDPQSHVVADENLMANLENFPMVQNVSFCYGKNVTHTVTT